METHKIGLIGPSLDCYDAHIGFITENWRPSLEDGLPILKDLNLVEEGKRLYQSIRTDCTWLAMVDGQLSVIAEHLIPMDVEDYDA